MTHPLPAPLSRRRAVGRAALQGAAELLLFGALPYIGAVYGLPAPLRWLWLASLPLLYAAGCAAQLALRPSRKLALYACALALAAAHAALLAQGGWAAYWIALPGWLLAYRGMRMGQMPWSGLFPGSLAPIGLGLYLISALVLRFIPSFAPYAAGLTWLGAGALVLALFLVNHLNLEQETLSGRRKPVVASAVRWHNRLLIALLLLVAMFTALLQPLGQVVVWLKTALIGLLKLLLQPSEQSAEPVTQPPPSAPPPGLGEAGPPSPWWVWLEKAAMIAAAAFACALVLAALVWLARRLPGWLRRGWRWLTARLGQGGWREASDGYEDEVESLMIWDDWRDRFFHRSRRQADGYEDAASGQAATNEARLRAVYRRWLSEAVRAGFRFRPASTPREIARELSEGSLGDRRADREATAAPDVTSRSRMRLVQLYERVRYGGQSVTEAELREAQEAAELGAARPPGKGRSKRA